MKLAIRAATPARSYNCPSLLHATEGASEDNSTGRRASEGLRRSHTIRDKNPCPSSRSDHPFDKGGVAYSR